LSRFITNVERAAFFWICQMDSQFRAFESVLTPDAGTPLRCPRPMVAQTILVWTPARLAAALFAGLASAPVQLAPALITRRRA
jgi:hypothetical protein